MLTALLCSVCLGIGVIAGSLATERDALRGRHTVEGSSPAETVITPTFAETK